MPSYLAIFHASHCYAEENIPARTPEQALKKARALYDLDPTDLDWYDYDADYNPLEAISITSPDGAIDCWQSDDLLLQQAAGDLLEALTDLLNQIDSLTGESSCIDEDIKQGKPYRAAKAACAKAKGGAA